MSNLGTAPCPANPTRGRPNCPNYPATSTDIRDGGTAPWMLRPLRRAGGQDRSPRAVLGGGFPGAPSPFGTDLLRPGSPVPSGLLGTGLCSNIPANVDQH